MTLYRTSEDTKIVEHLITAAKNGKDVTVVVELTASFDEKANIEWASRLEKVGIHVSYGVLGIKTHSKVIVVVRKEASGLKCYAHIGTGNYHARNAKIYSDLGVLTVKPDLTADVCELFNYLTTGCAPIRPYQVILTAPQCIKNTLLTKIAREKKNASKGKTAYICFKSNALEDPDIVSALYEASNAGVKIELIIRDICRLRPNLSGFSENINVISIIGRFLEHSRIYHFHNAGEDEYFIGSADLMTRNLERRIEVLIPIRNIFHKNQLIRLLDSQLTDQRSAWEMKSNGTYQQRRPHNAKNNSGCQEMAIKEAAQRVALTEKISSASFWEIDNV